MKPNSNKTLWSLLVIFTSVLTIFVTTYVSAYTINTYNHSEGDAYISPMGYFTLTDGSQLLRFYRPLNNRKCNEPDLHLRVLHVNGTMSPFVVQNFSIPKFIAEVDSDGNILGENWLGYNNYYNGSIVGRLGKFKFIFDLSDTFYYMKLADIHDPDTLEWQKFKITPITGRLQKGESGVISRKDLNLQYDNPIYSFLTIDSGLGFIYSKRYSSQVNAELQPSLYIYVNFYKPENENKKLTEPFIIYQTSTPNLSMNFAMCSVDIKGIGYQCVIQLRKTTEIDPLNKDIYYGHNLVLIVSFLSSGSVTRIVQLTGNYAKADSVVKVPLIYGGYLLMYRNSVLDVDGVQGCLLGGDIFDTNDMFNSTWDIPPNFTIQSPCIFIYNFIYKTFDMIWKITPTDLTIVSTDVPTFLYIEGSVNPKYGKTITLGRNTLEINYEVPISLSIRNITIYQVNGTNILMRQTTSGKASEFFTIEQNKITLKVLPSTFNVPSAEYHISIDPNFVMQKEINEPIDRLQHSSWVVITEAFEDTYAESFTGSIRLIPEGTKLFYQNKKEFIDQLLQEISLILPVDRDRLKIKDHQQVDSSTQFEQLIIPLQIEPTRNLSQRNTNNLYHDLNHMILNKQYTVISKYQYASLLDQSYGYKLNAGIKEIIRDNKETILSAIVVLFIIILDEERSNMIILKVGLSLMDFVLDGLFIYKNGYDIKILFIPSLVIFAFASIFNLILALSLIIYENFKHDKFKEWLKKNSIVASIFTLFSATNVEVLNVLTSKIGGFKMFSATFKKNTISTIFWLSVTNFIVKDIPQFGIQ
ncbi:14386_t:CDS:10 [Rhizophagus irregularis]|nr:14386_t:CDS:10 [Rhizophagus irregularis]